jgi:hypothetical protein
MFYQELTRITGTLYEGLSTPMIISRRILLRVRKFSDISCRESQITHVTFNNCFPKIMPFMRKCGKIWYSKTRRRCLYSIILRTEDALCMSDN